MDPTPTETPRTEAAPTAIIHPTKEERLRALVHQAANSPLRSKESSRTSALEEFHALVEAQTKRVDQIAAGMNEMWERVSSALSEMLDTLNVLRVVIGQSDELNQRQQDQMDQLGTVTAALARVTQETAATRDFILSQNNLDADNVEGQRA